jgi:hypothetical protein
VLDTGVCRGLGDWQHLGDPRLRIVRGCRHQQQAVDAVKRGTDRLEVVAVGLAHVDAAVGEIGGRSRVADAHRQRRVGRPPKHLLDDQAAELPVGSGDQQHLVGVSWDGWDRNRGSVPASLSA